MSKNEENPEFESGFDLDDVIRSYQKRIHAINEKAGWYNPAPDFMTAMALLHSEVSEAVEAWREHGTADMTSRAIDIGAGHAMRKPEGVGSEFADVFIRLLDDAALFGIGLAAEVERKLAFNATRSYRHGGKRA
jgi:NTP pyrophosphatase (non-canonical NTP hydrolase)